MRECCGSMESHGLPGRSSQRSVRETDADEFQFKERGQIQVKGIGSMRPIFSVSVPQAERPLQIALA